MALGSEPGSIGRLGRSPIVTAIFTKLVTTRPAICGTLTRMNDGASGEILRSGDLEVRPSEFLVLVRGRVLNFTKKEQQLLAVMMRSEGRILSREELYALVWGNKLKPGDRTVDVYVRKLRSRLTTAIPESKFIHTHFGFGYRYSPEPSHDTQNSVTSG